MKNREASLRALYELSIQLGTTLDLGELLNQVVDGVIELTEAERGYVMLANMDTGKLQPEAARNLERKTIAGSSIGISRTVVKRAIKDNEAILTTNAQEDLRFASELSVVDYQLRSIMCVPLRARGRTVGAVYVDNSLVTAAFDNSDLELLAMIGNQAALAIDNARLLEESQHYAQQLEQEVDKHKRTAHELKEMQEQAMRQQRLAVLGELAGGIGHELRNPLGVISNAVYFLNLTLSEADETTKEYLGMIGTRVQESEKIVSDLLSLSRTRAVERTETAVAALVKDALERIPVPDNVTVQRHIPAGISPAFVDSGQIRQVLVNLILNAYQAMPEGGELTIAGTERDGNVIIAVTDSGPGISEEVQAKIFEPLFTTKSKGTGLGLAVSQNLVAVNAGYIEVASMPERGARFRVVLPTKTAVRG